MTNIEGRIFLSGQRFKVSYPKTLDSIIPLATEMKIGFRRGAHGTITLAPEGLTLEIVAGAVELVKDKSTRGEIIGYRAVCTACHAESKRSALMGVRLESWANAHRCGREMVDAPDARKKAARK